jgi:hypothetical protein
MPMQSLLLYLKRVHHHSSATITTDTVACARRCRCVHAEGAADDPRRAGGDGAAGGSAGAVPRHRPNSVRHPALCGAEILRLPEPQTAISEVWDTVLVMPLLQEHATRSAELCSMPVMPLSFCSGSVFRYSRRKCDQLFNVLC